MSATEITVIIKGDSDSLKTKFLSYDNILNDELVNQYVNQCKQKYQGIIESVTFKLSCEVY